jgi:two-component system OmpR family sensor kinase
LRWARRALALVPAVIGLVVAALAQGTALVPNPVLYVHVDAGTLALLAGSGLSLLAGAGLFTWELVDRRRRDDLRGAHQQAAEDRRRFLQRLDHELKNPLTAIRAGLANLADGAAAEAEQQALVSVEAQVLRISRLTADLRKLTELETRPVERDAVAIGPLLEEAVALARERPGSESRRVMLSLPQAPWPLPDVQGDWDLLFLATHNLLDNALKFTRPEDTVEVRALEDGDWVAIEVADTGPGIPAEDLPRVWEELYRSEAARGVPGSGLGLALVRAIVERHGGDTAIRSRAGQGTVVTIRLPATG